MTLSTVPTLERARPSQYRWIPLAIVGAFLFVIAVNGGLVYFALSSWPGLTTDHAYNEGLAYNRVIDEVEKESKLGWKLETVYHPGSPGGGYVQVSIRDAAGAPVDGAALVGELIRPIEQMPPVPLSFAAQGEGTYRAQIVVPRPGQWDLFFSAKRSADIMRGGRRIQVPAP